MRKLEMKKNKNTSPIVDELVKQRLKRKLTQEELAQIVGCPQSSIARIESGLVSPTLNMVDKICDALSITAIFKNKL